MVPAAALVLVVAGVAACGSSRPAEHGSAPTVNYLPGVAADIYPPAAATPRAPVVLLVPGGE
jgi:hypothetical protein